MQSVQRISTLRDALYFYRATKTKKSTFSVIQNWNYFIMSLKPLFSHPHSFCLIPKLFWFYPRGSLIMVMDWMSLRNFNYNWIVLTLIRLYKRFALNATGVFSVSWCCPQLPLLPFIPFSPTAHLTSPPPIPFLPLFPPCLPFPPNLPLPLVDGERPIYLSDVSES